MGFKRTQIWAKRPSRQPNEHYAIFALIVWSSVSLKSACSEMESQPYGRPAIMHWGSPHPRAREGCRERKHLVYLKLNLHNRESNHSWLVPPCRCTEDSAAEFKHQFTSTSAWTSCRPSYVPTDWRGIPLVVPSASAVQQAIVESKRHGPKQHDTPEHLKAPRDDHERC